VPAAPAGGGARGWRGIAWERGRRDEGAESVDVDYAQNRRGDRHDAIIAALESEANLPGWQSRLTRPAVPRTHSATRSTVSSVERQQRQGSGVLAEANRVRHNGRSLHTAVNHL
jgi:hypothetical protein